jgi:hypothetical protein
MLELRGPSGFFEQRVHLAGVLTVVPGKLDGDRSA